MRLPLWAIRWLNRQKLSRRHMRGGKLHSWFGDRILAKELWRPSASSLARAWLVGFPITVTPFLPLQSVFATIAALLVRGNLFLCIAMQFLSTPLTAPVHLPACYFVGELVLGRTPREAWSRAADFRQHIGSLDQVLAVYVGPLYRGGVVVGLLGGVIGYAVILRTWRDGPRPHRRRHP